MAYSFTPIPDFVFDQVLSFTLGNTILDNAQDTHDSFSEEHTFSDGTHGRISEYANLLMNPTARRGNTFWWDAGAAADYDTTDPDVEYANPANFTYQHWTGPLRTGSRWSHVPATAWVGDLSEKIYVSGASVPLVLSAEIQLAAYVAGDCYVDVVCYDAGGLVLAVPAGDVNGLCQIKVSTTVGLFASFEAAGITPANTEYVRVRKWVNAAADASVFRVRQIKLEGGTVATVYSDESSMAQYLSARYGSIVGFSVPDDAITTVNFEAGPAGTPLAVFTWDDPGVNRVTVGANWEFEADRFMKLRVSSAIRFDAPVPWRINDFAILYLEIDLGAGFTTYAVLDRKDYPVAITKPTQMNGGTTITLDKGMKLRIRIHQKSGAPRALKNDIFHNYIDIEEIS